MIRRLAILACCGLAAGFGPPVQACENDGIPGYNHATGRIDAEPYADAYADVADRVAIAQREASIERARLAFVARFDLADAPRGATPGSDGLLTAVSTRPDDRD
jgi:hypothetical protein